jgi:hypothetical protein
MPDGFHGYGTVLQVGDGASPEVFTSIAALSSIKLPTLSTADIDMSHLTTTNAFREMLPGMRSAGKVGFTGNYTPAGATHKNASGGLLFLQRTRAIVNWKIVLSDPDSTEWLFTGYVSNIDPGEAGLDSKVEISGEITITTDPTLP